MNVMFHPLSMARVYCGYMARVYFDFIQVAREICSNVKINRFQFESSCLCDLSLKIVYAFVEIFLNILEKP